MNRLFLFGCLLALVSALLLAGPAALAQEDTGWSPQKAAAWFTKAVWLEAKPVKQLHYDTFGRVLDDDAADSTDNKKILARISLVPHASINKEEFARQYNKDKVWWDEAFAYLQHTDLAALKPGKFSIDEDNVLVTVTEGMPRRTDTTKWESHLVYDDIHYVISGREKIGVAPVASVKQDGLYNPVRDLLYYTGNAGKYYDAVPGVFYVFFPQDAHRPNLQLENQMDKKIVIKVRRSTL